MAAKFSMRALAFLACLLAIPAGEMAQTAGWRALITQAIDENKLVTLAGNTRPEAMRQNDLGPVSDDLHLDMYLQLKRSPEQEQAAKEFVESLTDKDSPNFHHWLTAAEYGSRFGANPADIATVSRWLESHGFTVNRVPAHNMVIDFSGSAAQVREAFHTEIHYLNVAGHRRFANMSDPRIPAALLPAATGVVSFNNIPPRPMFAPKAQYTVTSTNLPVVPGDLATIYNLNGAYSAGYTGKGQTITVIEDSDLYNGANDWITFRQTFGLNQYSSGSLTQVHPGPGAGGSCADLGVTTDAAEAAIDVEWASAAAPNAAVVMASCAGTTNFGGFIALQNLLTNGGPLPSVVSISYALSETEAGAALNSYIDTLYQTAAAEGVSVFVATGDSGAAASDNGDDYATFGIGVNALASTPYNVAVGGADFGDTAAGATGTYWSATNGAYYNSAKSYIPEIPWNASCGSSIAATYNGYATSYGPAGFCAARLPNLNTVAAGGGPSGCATGTPTLNLAVSGACAGYPKPSWQSIFGNPNDGVRDLPDVSLFASDGTWGHYYVACFSSKASCSGPPSGWAGYGGTSFAAPIMAGIQALINQAASQTNLGNPNPVYYQIARNEYTNSSSRSACNSTTGSASTCSFNDVTQGDIVVACSGAFNCYVDGLPVGVLSTSSTSYAPAYAAGSGWDFATGIGTVNASNLLSAYANALGSPTRPTAPALLSPANGATGVSAAPTLSWNASTGATSYDVYFGTASAPPLVTNTAGLTYAPGTLSPGTTYYWAVGARNSAGANESAAWSFTTASASCAVVLNPSSATISPAGGTGTIPVTATTGCAWTAVSNVPWITITAGATGSGNGTVGYTVAANTGAQRVGTLTIASQTFTVTQQAGYPLISTIVGGTVPATAAVGTSLSIPTPAGVATDASGNLYFSSSGLNAVFKASPGGLVTRIAGNGIQGYSGDGGPAVNAQLNDLWGVAVDSVGNVYIADDQNQRIRKVDTSGNITTVVGNGGGGFFGDGGPATSAELWGPMSVAVDMAGNLYIADTFNQRIRKVNTSGIITTVAGGGGIGYSGDGGPATSAELDYPFAVAVDAAGNLYIADDENCRIRKVNASGIITTVAGTGVCGYSGDGSPATSAQLYYPHGLTVDTTGNLYIADWGSARIRKVNVSGIITTVAGNGGEGFSGDGGAATGAEFNNPQSVAIDVAGNLYIADEENWRVREVSAAGVISTLAGGVIGDGGLAVFGVLNEPVGVARDNAGNTYVVETASSRVRKVWANGIITTVVGTGVPGFNGDGGPAASAELNEPQGLAVDAAGSLYIADHSNSRVRKVDPFGNITTVAGNGAPGYSGDGGLATSAQLIGPEAVALDSSGNVYIADTATVRKVNTSGIITTVAGNGNAGYSGDGGPATSAQLYNPVGVALDGAGNLYIADSQNSRVREVNLAGIITTVAGNGSHGYSGDGGPATSAQLWGAAGVAVDAGGDLYIADSGNNRIRRVTGGIITTVAGNGASTNSGDGGSAISAGLQDPFGIAIDAAGFMVISGIANNTLRLLTPPGAELLAIQSAHTGLFAQNQTGATYTLTVSNIAGAGPTSGIVGVIETLPSWLTLTAMSGPGWYCATPFAATCTRSDSLSPGSSYPPITVTVNVSASAPSQVTNQVGVYGGGGNIAGAEDLTLINPVLTITGPATLPTGQVGSPYSQTLTASYGTAPYTWSIVSGRLPFGLSLSPSTGVISGTPTSALTTLVTFQVADSSTPPQTAAVTLTVSIAAPGPVSISTTSLASGTVGAPYAQTLSAVGGQAPYSWSLTSGVLPAGLTLSTSTGTIGGTPTAAVTNTRLTFRVTDSSTPPQTATATLSLTIAAGPLTITTSGIANGQVGTPYSQTMTASGGTTPYTWSVIAGKLPPGLSLNSATGVIGGTPTSALQSMLTLQVTDSGSPQQTAGVVVTIIIQAAPLTLTTPSLANAKVGVAYSQALAVAGGTSPYSWSATGLPAGLAINSSSGAISGTTTATGTATVAVTVTDSSIPQQTATKSYSLTVQSSAGALTITTTSLPTGQVGSPYFQTLTATGGLSPYTWSIVSGRLPFGLSLNPSTGVIGGTPTSALTTLVTFQVADSSTPPLTATVTLTVSVAAPGPVSIATTSLPNGTVGVPYSQTLTATGGQSPYTWSLASGVLPAGLTLETSTGTIGGTPSAAVTNVRVIFAVTDSSTPPQTATATLTLTIDAGSSAPPTLSITTTALPNAQVGTPYSQTVTATGGTGSYTWSATGLPATISINAQTGAITGTPTAAAAFTVSVTAKDQGSPQQSATRSFTLTVLSSGGPLTITTTSLPAGQVGAEYSQTLAATGGTGAYTWSVISGRLPFGLTLSSSTGVISGTPSSSLSTLVTFQVADAGSPQQTATIPITMTIQ